MISSAAPGVGEGKAPACLQNERGGEIRRHDKIRVGYVSPDFRKHPVGYLTAEIFESHDPDRFETYAFSIGPDDNSDLRKRLEKSFHRFVDCEHKLDGEVLKAIDDAQIDILVDLAGHTHNARLSLFAASPAPIVVNYLGFAGTLGSGELVDYIIADPIVLPDQNSEFFDEKVVRLPGSFMPRDNRVGTIDDAAPDRADHDLRQEWTVFCCFNNAYKINPAVFGSWMNILKSVDQSVLWLSDVGEIAKSNLRKEAKGRGVDPDRLVFARRVASSSEHLGRHRLADLFLDTLPYNAHTTASDALWAGLPVVTHIGNSFAGRVAASLLSAVGLPELITRTRADYEALAIELALDKQKLADIRGRLQGNHLTASLFDAALYAKRLETAFEAMYQRYQTAWRRIISKFQRADGDDDRSRLMVRPASSRRGGPRRVLRLIPRFDRLRSTAERLHGCEGPVPELLTANETRRKNPTNSSRYKVALITSACYLCNTWRKTRSIGSF
ncbi:hypothetical protein [Bradyrhizobium sp. URHA0013]|uniref:O-linked N-acetylglucosamine transferase, SPINDLY family protein n=1 Tax=Bradyrhizobium sp. URHA0013 TaxID=1380352 RepID=UPI00047F0738|nr:hypothetical protein [Bradyrhizobium sp. URHA0013]